MHIVVPCCTHDPTHLNICVAGGRGGSVVGRRTPMREVRVSKPTFLELESTGNTQEAVAPS